MVKKTTCMNRGIGVLALTIVFLTWGTGVRAQDYSSTVVFGDSLSDSGNVGVLLGLPSGTSYTTNPDPVWSEIVARTFGSSGMDSESGGSNYAYSGACAASGACNFPVPNVGDQIDMYLARRPSGNADPAALHAVWAGGNDIGTILFPSVGVPPPDPETAVLVPARAVAGHVRRLQRSGARHVLVFNLPDLGKLPFADRLARENPQQSAAFSRLSVLFNQELDAGLRSLDIGIIPINAFALFNEMIASPATFGFDNVRETACAGFGPEQNSSFCGPTGSGMSHTYEPGANRTHLFADPVHPGGGAHAMIASVVTATLAAPLQVSLAGEAGVASAALHRRAMSVARLPEPDAPVGSWRGYSSVHAGGRSAAAPQRLGKSRADVRAVTLGVENRAATGLRWGLAATLGRDENGVHGAELDSDTAFGSLYGSWRRDDLRLDGTLNLGTTRVGIERSIRLGPAVRRERGLTSADLFGLDLDLGWTVHRKESLRQGVTLGVSWLDQEVNGYRENGTSSSAMTFSGFDRNSLILRVGYRVVSVTSGAR